MKSNEGDQVRISHIKEAIALILEFTSEMDFENFARNKLVQSAVTRQFEIIGEAASNISDETKNSFPEIEWRKIKGFRNLLIHEYFRVDSAELWEAITHDISILDEQINRFFG